MKPSALDLWWLADHAHDLAQARLRGTARPWRQPAEDTDPERRAERELLAVLERQERSGYALGEHPAPMHVDVADVVVDLLMTADDLAERVAQAAGVDRLPPASSAFADPVPYLRHAAAHLQMAAEADPVVGGYVEREAARLRSVISVHLGELTTGQTVPGLCPWCSGGIARRKTLRIRLVRSGEVMVPAAVCESDVCQPPEADVGLWHYDRPAWPLFAEGDWLAKRIRHAMLGGPTCVGPKPTEEDEDAVCGEPLIPSGQSGRPPARYCGAACRRAADAKRRREEREAS